MALAVLVVLVVLVLLGQTIQYLLVTMENTLFHTKLLQEDKVLPVVAAVAVAVAVLLSHKTMGLLLIRMMFGL